MNVVVRFAFDGLQVELAGDLHDRLDAQAVHLDCAEAVVHLTQRLEKIIGAEIPGQAGQLAAGNRRLSKYFEEVLDGLPGDLVGVSRNDLVGTRLIFEILHDVARENRPDCAECEGQVELESATVYRALVETVLGEQEHAE